MNDKQERNQMEPPKELSSKSARDRVAGDAKSNARQLPDSKFITKVENIPVVHNIWVTVLTSYSLIKGQHPILKETLERGEDAAYWMEQKAENIATFTKLNEPLKKIDSAAFNSVVKIEDTQANVSI